MSFNSLAYLMLKSINKRYTNLQYNKKFHWKGKDVLASAQTGTGKKTAGFTLPIFKYYLG
jgi:superfamily II DNA/RNA helicase